MSNPRRFIKITLILAFGALCICSGIVYGQKTSEPIIKYVEVPIVVPIEVPTEVLVEVPTEVLVEVPVIRTVNHYIIKEKEIVVEKPVQLREFASLEDLKTWLANDNTDALHLIFSDEGGLRTSPNFQDCDDYAYALQTAAEKDGYQLSIQIDTRKKHALNSLFIGNNVYFIEPQTDEVWLECYRDKM